MVESEGFVGNLVEYTGEEKKYDFVILFWRWWRFMTLIESKKLLEEKNNLFLNTL